MYIKTVPDDLRYIGENIRRYREDKRLSQPNLARAAGLGHSAISAIETGVCLPRADTLLELCRVLEVTPNDILQRSDKKK